MGDPTKGLSPAVRAAVAKVEGDEWSAADQLPLFGSPRDAAAFKAGELVKPARGGRPPGAQNKSTTAWSEYIRARYTDPREFLAQLYSRNSHALAVELDCTLLDAVKVQEKAANDLLPYVASKMPATVKLEDEQKRGIFVAILGLQETDPNDAPDDDFAGITIDDPESI